MVMVQKFFRKISKFPQFVLFTSLLVFAFSLALGIRADANPMPVQTLSGTITSSQTLNPGIVYIVNPDVSVASGATLTIPAGTIVKFQVGSITVQSGGSLRVTGTAANPVHFTSYKDDTVGGDSNNDGTTSTPAIDDYGQAIVGNNGDINIVFAKFRYSSRTIDATRTSGNIVITDSTFEESRNAISATGPTVKLYRNKFNNLTPNSLDGGVQVNGAQDLTRISLSGVDQNVFIGANKFSKIIRINQSVLPLGKTWSPAVSSGAIVYFQDKTLVDGVMTVPANVTMIVSAGSSTLEIKGILNIQGGALVKFDWSGSLRVVTAGKINIAGAPASPVRFTSIKDDTIGGDTNGDGAATSPAQEDYNALVGYGGEVAISHAKFSYSQRAFAGEVSTMVVTDTVFEHGKQALALYSSQHLTLQRNIFSMEPGQYDAAVDVYNNADISNISLTGADRNLFVGNPWQRTLRLNSVTVPSGKTLNVGADSGVVLSTSGSAININGTLNLNQNSLMAVYGSGWWGASIQLRGTMNVDGGAVVKFADTQGISVFEGATLNINGTSSNKAHLTSLKDDTVGGDINGDGTGSTPAPLEIESVIYLNGGDVYAMNADVKYARRGISGQSSNSLKVFDTSFKYTGTAIEAEVPHVKIYRNTFDVAPETNKSALELLGVQDISRVGFSGSDQNYLTGVSGSSRIAEFRNSKLPSDRSLTVAQTSGASIGFKGIQNEVHGTLNLSDNTKLVLLGSPSWLASMNLYGTLNIQQGVVVKLLDTQGIIVREQGRVNIDGTPANTVKVTHYFDDSIGGDTNSDGAATAPAVGSTFLSMSEATQTTVSNIDMYYGGTGFYMYAMGTPKLTVNGLRAFTMGALISMHGGEAGLTEVTLDGGQDNAVHALGGSMVLRGRLTNIQGQAIAACNWGQNCSVDAAYVDWGTTSGPPAGKVCGQVTVTPWVGGNSSEPDRLFTSKNCDGSPTPSEQVTSSTQHFSQRMSIKGIDCSNGFQDACQAMQTAQTCLGAATQLAQSTSSFPLPNGNAYEQPAQWGNMLAGNASTFIQSVEGPNPILSAAGFATELLSAVSTVLNVANAYNTCAP